MSVRSKIRDDLRERFVPALKEGFEKCFNRQITTNWSIFAMTYVTSTVDGKALTKTQRMYIAGFEDAWLAAGDTVSA